MSHEPTPGVPTVIQPSVQEAGYREEMFYLIIHNLPMLIFLDAEWTNRFGTQVLNADDLTQGKFSVWLPSVVTERRIVAGNVLELNKKIPTNVTNLDLWMSSCAYTANAIGGLAASHLDIKNLIGLLPLCTQVNVVAVGGYADFVEYFKTVAPKTFIWEYVWEQILSVLESTKQATEETEATE